MILGKSQRGSVCKVIPEISEFVDIRLKRSIFMIPKQELSKGHIQEVRPMVNACG
jgi:hypothetical protein